MDCLCRSINITIQKLYYASDILVLGTLNGEKGQKLWLNGGQKYKIVNFEADDAFEVL